jgi:hypothetical protein
MEEEVQKKKNPSDMGLGRGGGGMSPGRLILADKSNSSIYSIKLSKALKPCTR